MFTWIYIICYALPANFSAPGTLLYTVHIKPEVVFLDFGAAIAPGKEQTVQTNPNNMQRYQEDEIYKGMIDARVAMFQQSIAQQQNAQIGRVGAERYVDELQGEQPFLGGQPPEQA